MRGAIVVALDDSSTPEFAARVAADAQVKFAFLSPSKPPFPPAIPSLLLEESSDASRLSTPLPARELCDKRITRDQVAQILFTSGTTSDPRVVVLTHGNFLANLEPLEKGIAEYRK